MQTEMTAVGEGFTEAAITTLEGGGAHCRNMAQMGSLAPDIGRTVPCDGKQPTCVYLQKGGAECVPGCFRNDAGTVRLWIATKMWRVKNLNKTAFLCAGPAAQLWLKQGEQLCPVK
jgi:hypothetical protein